MDAQILYFPEMPGARKEVSAQIRARTENLTVKVHCDGQTVLDIDTPWEAFLWLCPAWWPFLMCGYARR